MQRKEIKLGSLFDGIGGFPLAASLYGIRPVWASEILPTPISITRRHFPDMAHVGDITKLRGANLKPVDVICFGSPCQNFSTASNTRTGLAGSKSGLFFEAIRIINEMREATNGRYPRFAIWENVFGALSSTSNDSSDFRAVLEAFAQAEVPMPRSNRWATAGMVRSGNARVAWRLVDAARGWGVPQRRRRVFLVADFRGDSAGEILFKSKSLFGAFAQGGKARQDSAGNAHECAALTGRNCLTPWDVQSRRIYEMHSVWPSLYAGDGGGRGYLFSDAVDIVNDQGGDCLTVEKSGLAPTLRSQTHGNLPIVSMAAQSVHQNQFGDIKTGELAYTLTTATSASARNAPLVCHPQLSGTLCASAAGLSRPGGMASETDLCVAYCLQGNSIGRKDGNGPRGNGVNTNVSFSITAADRHAIAAVDCRNFAENPDVSGTLQSKSNGSYSLNYQNPVRTGYIVRRLMPIEAERLMGFPDNWTALTHDGKAVSDSARYQALGNAVVIPCVAFIMAGICEAMGNG